MYAKIVNNSVQFFPYSVERLKKQNSSVSFPARVPLELLAEYGVFPVFDSVQPSYDPSTQVVEESSPVFSQENSRWERSYSVRQASAEEIDQRNQQVKDEIVSATQERLDTFAQTKNYDSILSACTYAASPTSIFAMEGQYCVEKRDATWAKLYQILTEVQLGLRAMPTGYADIESELPELIWPST